MLTPRSALMRRVLAALDASPSRIPVLLGGCGSGRTTLVRQLHDRIGPTSAQYVDVERAATTPERFCHAVLTPSPFAPAAVSPSGARAAFDATLSFLSGARAGGGEPAVVLLDEFLELRTFESFPGLRRVLDEFLDGIAASPNRFALTSRYVARTLGLLRDRSARFEVIHMPPLTVEDTLDVLDRTASRDRREAGQLARTTQALADGRPAYVSAIAEELLARHQDGGPSDCDAIGALAAMLGCDGRVSMQCKYCYELRLHRARGYGALKAILDILAEEEGLTLTEISHRLQRTPGSTKDYLSWLEDVDLVTVRQRRYRYTDPLLRVWVRLHHCAAAPTAEEIAQEVRRYAMPRLLQTAEPALAMAAVGAPGEDDKKGWGIIEID